MNLCQDKCNDECDRMTTTERKRDKNAQNIVYVCIYKTDDSMKIGTRARAVIFIN